MSSVSEKHPGGCGLEHAPGPPSGPPRLGKEALAPPRAPRFSLRPSGGALQRQGEESASEGSACNGHNSRDSCGGRPECARAQRAEVQRGFPLPRGMGGRPSGRGTRQGSRALTDRRRQVRRQVRGTRVQTAGGARPCRAPSRSLPQDPREHPRGPSAVLGSGGEAGNHTAPPRGYGVMSQTRKWHVQPDPPGRRG